MLQTIQTRYNWVNGHTVGKFRKTKEPSSYRYVSRPNKTNARLCSAQSIQSCAKLGSNLCTRNVSGVFAVVFVFSLSLPLPESAFASLCILLWCVLCSVRRLQDNWIWVAASEWKKRIPGTVGFGAYGWWKCVCMSSCGGFSFCTIYYKRQTVHKQHFKVDLTVVNSGNCKKNTQAINNIISLKCKGS